MKNLRLSVVGLICALFVTTASAQVNSEQARNFQINEIHTGATTVDHLTPPLRQRWVVNFGRPISYPLIADGRVYVRVKNAVGHGTTLFALNATNGATLWSFALGGSFFWSGSCSVTFTRSWRWSPTRAETQRRQPQR